MCGIIALLRGPGARRDLARLGGPRPARRRAGGAHGPRPPSPSPSAAAVAARGARRAPAQPRWRRAARAATATSPPAPARRRRRRGRRLGHRRRGRSTPTVRPRATAWRTPTPRCSRLRTRSGRWSATGSHRRAACASSSVTGRRGRPSRSARRSSRHCPPSTAWRSAAATRPASPCSCATTASTSPTPPWRGSSRPRSATTCSARTRAHARGPSQLRLQGGRRDRRARRQHRGHARRPHGRRPAPPGHGRRPSSAARARPHPVGEHRDHLPAQRAPGRQPRDRRRADEPYVTAALNGDVDNFADLKAADGLRLAAEITTDAKVIPTLVSRRLAEGIDLTDAFRDTVAALRGLGGHRRRAPRPTPAACCSPCGGAARRSTWGWPTGATSSPRSPTAS